MASRQKLDSQIQMVQTLGDLMMTREEVYVLRMLKVRNSVLRTRNFMEGLIDLFNELRYAYLHELAGTVGRGHGKTSGGKSLSVLKKNKQAVAVLLSASEKPYGEVNEKIFQKFWDFLQKNPEYEVVITGQLGSEMYVNQKSDRPFRYFDLLEEGTSINELRPLIDHIIQYEEVKVFYGKFESFINQRGDSVTISGTAPLEVMKRPQLLSEEKFLFEPSLEEILGFFETQIFALLLRQIALESYLSQIGSRVIALETSTTNIEERSRELLWKKKMWLKGVRNKKKLQNLVGLSFWKSLD